MSGGDNMSREEKTIWSEEKIFAVNHNAHAAAPARRRTPDFRTARSLGSARGSD